MAQGIVAITGAAGDIGHAMSLRFLARGYAVAAMDINWKALTQRRNEAQPSDRYYPFEIDVTNATSVTNAFAAVEAELGQSPDILINNAGGISAHNLQTTTEETWARDIELNLSGAWRCINAVYPGFLTRKKGMIVNIASVNGLGIFGHPGYSVAKAGLIHLTRFAAVEFGKHGVRTVAICPGTVKTRAWVERQKQQPSIIEDALSWYPSRIASEPDDVAKLAEFAALDAPQTMNGSIIEADGGLSAGHDVVASAFCGDDI